MKIKVWMEWAGRFAVELLKAGVVFSAWQCAPDVMEFVLTGW